MSAFGGVPSPFPSAEDDVVRDQRDLARRQMENAAQAGTAAYLKTLIVRGTSVASFSTGKIPGDQTQRWYDSSPVTQVTLAAPTGRVLVTAGCGEASLAPGNSSAVAHMSFRIETPSGWLYVEGIRGARLFLASPILRLGTSMQVNIPANVPKTEPITVTAKFGIWSSSATDLAEATFNSPYLTVEVIDPI